MTAITNINLYLFICSLNVFPHFTVTIIKPTDSYINGLSAEIDALATYLEASVLFPGQSVTMTAYDFIPA